MSDQNAPINEQQLFEEASAISDPAARTAFLDGVCRGNPSLRARLDVLFEAHDKASGFLDTITDDASYAEAKLSEGPGSVIGKFKLLEQIGEGGMGVVYMAEQSVPFNKRVALKIIKLGMDTKGVVARFEAERQALALMNHPNIAKVLDAGATDTGRPYFVMELVRGVPITDYCDRNKLSTAQRLELFIPVCQAIQHAHLKGIIHRDIKPSNILVALFDGRPVPMVIDFGIAKATNQRLTEKTVFTRHAQLIGTPAYMSPEQAEGSQLDIDTRSDIYSLGVLLYELLTGSQPFPEQKLRSAGWKEMQRIIMEDDPPRPSTRFSTLTDEERTSIRKSHDEDPRKISLVLRRELDWIVMMCLEKDRAKRYETANALASDVGKYLKGEAIIAVPPTPIYQLSKLVRRHKKTFAMAAAIAVILAVATVFSAWQAVRAKRAEKIAVDEALFSGTLNDFLLEDLLSISDAWADDTRGAPRKVDLTLFEAIQAAEKLVATRFANHTNTEARVRLIIGRALRQFTNSSAALDNLKRAYELSLQSNGEAHTNTLESKLEYGSTLYMAYRDFFRGTASSEKAKREADKQLGYRLVLEAKDTCEARLPPGHPLTSRALLEAAKAVKAQDFLFPDRVELNKHGEEARRLLERAIASAEIAIASGNEKMTPFRLRAKGDMSTFFDLPPARGRLHARELLRDEEAWHRKSNPQGQYSLRYVGVLYHVIWNLQQWDRDFAQADRLIERGLAISKPQVGRAPPTGWFYADLIRIPAIDRGDFVAAYSASREAMACMEETMNNSEWNRLYAGYVLSDAAAWGDWQQTLNELVSMRERGLGRDDQGRGYTMNLARELIVRHMLGETNLVPELRQQFWDGVGDQKLLYETEMLLALPFGPSEREKLAALTAGAIARETDLAFGTPASADFLRGLKALKLDGDLAVARAEFEKHPEWPHSCFYLAQIHFRLGNTVEAIKWLDKGTNYYEQFLARGHLRTWWFNDETWTSTARAVIARDEAETLIYTQPVARKPLKEYLADKRPGWSEVRKLLDDARWESRHRRFSAAKAIYRQVTNHPAYNFRSANAAHRVGIGMFIADWAMGNAESHIAVLRQMHDGMATNQTDYLFQLAEVPWTLPPDLEVRRDQSPARAWLDRRAADPKSQLNGEDQLVQGMLRYRDGKWNAALEILPEDIKGRAFAAMANWKLERKDEARKLVREADKDFNDDHIVPGEGRYAWWYPSDVMMEMVIKEADQLIDPDEINAPHVAALPAEGW